MEHDPYRNERETLAEHRGLTGDHPEAARSREEKPVSEAFRNLVHFLKAPS